MGLLRAIGRPALLVATSLAASLTTSCAGTGAASGNDAGGRDATAGAGGSGSSSGGNPNPFPDDGPCEVCDAGCSNGLVTMCLVLTGSCGSQPSISFCPYGCSPDAPGGCNLSPFDGAVTPGCIASAATIQQGVLQGQGTPVAVTTFLSPTAERVIIASSASVACAIQGGDAGTGAPLNGAAITFMADTCCTGASGAQLTVWKNGVVVIDAQNATSGSAGESLNQPGTGGGTMGGYNLTFGSDVEEGSFVAPTCDICAGVP
jgi:hypothetical protein